MLITGYRQNFDIVPLFTHMQSNEHAKMSKNFAIVPLFMSPYHHNACIHIYDFYGAQVYVL